MWSLLIRCCWRLIEKLLFQSSQLSFSGWKRGGGLGRQCLLGENSIGRQWGLTDSGECKYREGGMGRWGRGRRGGRRGRGRGRVRRAWCSAHIRRRCDATRLGWSSRRGIRGRTWNGTIGWGLEGLGLRVRLGIGRQCDVLCRNELRRLSKAGGVVIVPRGCFIARGFRWWLGGLARFGGWWR